MAGTRGKVSRIVAAAALVAFVAAGCGSAPRSRDSGERGIPRVLAQDWANQASAIAAASSAGNSCHALQLASSLRTEVIAAEGKVPTRLRSPLLSGVNSLADRITCTDTVTVQAPPPKHGDHHHDHHGPGGDDKKGHG